MAAHGEARDLIARYNAGAKNVVSPRDSQQKEITYADATPVIFHSP